MSKRGRGRPSSYKPEYAEQARKMCEAFGATNIELADFFGTTFQTINQWRTKYPEFDDALKAGKEAADQRVERRLYERATGYSYDAVKIFNEKGTPLIVPYREHVPPDTTACIFWLKNRQPALWRDKRDHELTGKDGERLFDGDDIRNRLLGQLVGQVGDQEGDQAPARRSNGSGANGSRT